MVTAKKPKDPNAPKKPLSGYFSWMQAEREKLKAEKPELKGPAAVKVLGERWAAMAEEEKQPYNDEAATAKAKYNEEMEAYRKTDSYAKHQEELQNFKMNSAGKKKKKAKIPKDANAPKKPQTAYFLWLTENRERIKQENPDVKAGPAIVKLAGSKWAAMTDDQKKPYQERAVEAKKQYEIDFAKYKESAEYTQHQERVEQFKRVRDSAEKPKSGKKKQKFDPNAPKKPPSAFDCFAEQMRADVDQKLSFTAQTAALRTQWRGMSAEQKAPYIAGAKKCKEAYKESMNKYLASGKAGAETASD